MSGVQRIQNRPCSEGGAEQAEQRPAGAVLPEVTGFFHIETNSISYVVRDPGSQHAVLIDTVLDYDPVAARSSTEFADRLLDYVQSHELQIDWILETHAHADHLSAAQYLKKKLGAPVAIGRHIRTVQQNFARLFNLGESFAVDGSQFDRLLDEGDQLAAGNLKITVLHTPGHTPACVTYRVGDAAFVGDTLFMPDYGTARADFPGGDAHKLYHSIQKILSLPTDTRLYMCHDYMPASRLVEWETTVGKQRRSNIHVHDGIGEAEFVAMREKRDAHLGTPRLILPAIQFNIRAGAMPEPESNGVSYLKIPLNILR